MRLLVTGASGLLGITLGCQAAEQHSVVGVVNSRPLPGAPFATRQADLTQPGELERLLDEVAPQAIVHCAAIARPDDCERDPAQAERINARLPGEIAAAARERSLRLIHISTEAIFDGARGNYAEDDAPNPLNVYARTKLAGEQAVLAADPQATIARVIFYGWSLSGERSLAEWFYNNLSACRPVRGFTDAIFCPLLVSDLAGLLLEMLARELSGVFHVASVEAISKYEFGVRIARRFGLDESLIAPASVHDSNLPARRSSNLSLRTEKLAQALGRPLPGQDQGLEHFYSQAVNGYRERVRAMGQIETPPSKPETSTE